VDGFLAAPVPVDALRNMGADVVIAVFLEAANNRKPASIVDVIAFPSQFATPRGFECGARRFIIEPIVKDFLWDRFREDVGAHRRGRSGGAAACRTFARRPAGLPHERRLPAESLPK